MPIALITGASMGIGEAFAQQLGARRYDLILVARSGDRLQALATELSQKYSIKTETIVADLTEPQACQRVSEQVEAWGWSIDLLINNAGFGDYGEFAQRDGKLQSTMVQLNIQALVELTHWVLPTMQQRNSGAIINVASIAAFQPMPYMSVYAATKAFVLSFSSALWAENKDRGIYVQCLCPGATETNFAAFSGLDKAFAETSTNQFKIATAPDVVRESLAAMDKKQAIVVTSGPSNRLIAGLGKLLPNEFSAKMTAKIFGGDRKSS
jgi:uncharacterized protein